MQHGLRHLHRQPSGRVNLWLHHLHRHRWVRVADHDLDLGIFLHQDLHSLVIKTRIFFDLDLFVVFPPILGDAALTHQRVFEKRICGHKTIVVGAEYVVGVICRLLCAGHIFGSTRHILHHILRAEEDFHQAWQHGADSVAHLHSHHLRAPIFLITKGVASVILSTLGANG